MLKHSKKRVDMLKKSNSKIIYLDCKEAELMYELLIKTNDVFKALRKAEVNEIEFSQADEIIKKFQSMMLKTSDVLSFISKKTAKPYSEPFMLAKIRNDLSTKRE